MAALNRIHWLEMNQKQSQKHDHEVGCSRDKEKPHICLLYFLGLVVGSDLSNFYRGLFAVHLENHAKRVPHVGEA